MRNGSSRNAAEQTNKQTASQEDGRQSRRPRWLAHRLHRYVALAAMLPLIVLSLTGALLVFESEIDRQLNSRLWYVIPQGERLPYQTLYEQVMATFPASRITAVLLPLAPDLACVFLTQDERRIHLDPYHGTILGERGERLTLMDTIYTLHVSFFAAEPGSYLAGATAMLLLVLIASGLSLWWPRGPHKWQAFVVKWQASWRRTNYDLHRAAGFYTSGLLVAIALTGAVFTFEDAVSAAVHWLSGAVPPNRQPRVTPHHDLAMIDLDKALAISARYAPDSIATTVTLPSAPDRALRITRRAPGQPVVTGRTYLYLDPYTGAVIQEISPRTAPLGTRLLMWNYPIHVGTFGGLATRLLWLLMSLIPTGLALTGIRIWWKPRKHRAARTATRQAGSSPGLRASHQQPPHDKHC